MKSTIVRAAAAAAVFTAIGAAPLAAQLSPIGFNVRAGAALPMGDFKDGANTGFTLGAGLSFQPALLPVGLRIDGDYNRLGATQELRDALGVDDLNFNIWSLTANAVLAPALSPIYGIGGLGFYDVGASGGGESDSDTELGFNVGAGFRLPLTGFNTFVEARYHSIGGEGGRTNYVPIVFGISF